jgi:uncharacterized membrane protein
MAIELKCKTCGKNLPTAKNGQEQVALCTECANALVAVANERVPLAQSGVENPYQSYVPPPRQVEQDSHAAMHPVQNTVPRFGSIVNQAVTVWKANLWMLIVALLITFFVIPIGFNMAFAWVQGIVSTIGNVYVVTVFNVIFSLVATILNIFLGIGSTKFFLQVLRGGPANLGLLFQGGNRLLPVLGLLILWSIVPVVFVIVYNVLFNVNQALGVGVWAALTIFFVVLFQWFWPSYYLVVDRRVSVIESLRLAKQITKGNNGNTCYVFLVWVGLFILGAIPCGVGLLFTCPLMSLLWGSAYLKFSGQIGPTEAGEG